MDTLKDSKYTGHKGASIQSRWRRVAAFDPERDAILLVAGTSRVEEDVYRRPIREGR